MTPMFPAPELGPDTVTARPYQIEAIHAVRSAMSRGVKSALIIHPTGTGKSTVMSKICRSAVEKSNRVLVLAHREELITQMINTLDRVGITAAIEKASANARDTFDAQVVVASVQTMQRKRLASWPADHFALMLVDEAHHATALSYKKIFRHFRCARLIGVTATPDRSDKENLQSVFEHVAHELTLWEMMTAAEPGPYLCRLEFHQLDVDVDLRGIRKNKDDFNLDDLRERIAPMIGTLANAIRQKIEDRPTIVFTPDVASATAMASAMKSMNMSAEWVSGDCPDRAEKVADYADGSTQIMVNCALLTEGFDAPRTSAIALCRPTKSRALYCLDSRTEILTNKGWAQYDGIADDTLAAAYDTETGEIIWSPVLAKVRRDLAPGEKMFGLESPGISIRVTGNHRMVYRKRAGRSRKRTEWMICPAEQLSAVPDMFEIPCAGEQASIPGGEASGLAISDDDLRFIGWFLTDGGINKITNAITIYQSDHQPYNKDIIECLVGCGFKYRNHVETRSTQFSALSVMNRYTVSKGIPRGQDKHLTGWGRLEPYIDKDLSPSIEGISSRQLRVLLEAIHLGDGSKQKGQTWTRRSYHITTGNKTFADRLQSLCIRRGLRCNVAPMTYNNTPAYMLHIKDEAVRYVGGASSKDRPILKEVAREPGEQVWCIQTSTGTIVTRRNGKSAIMGNSQQVGRGTRLYPRKDKCLLIDFNYLTDEHDLVRPADLFESGDGADEVRRLTDELLASGVSADLIEVVEQAKKQAAADKQRRLEVELKAREREIKYRRETVFDPLNPSTATTPSQLLRAMTSEPPTPKMIGFLKWHGHPNAASYSRGHAGKLISLIKAKEAATAASPNLFDGHA